VAPIPSDGLGFIPPKAHERDRWTRSQPDARARLAEEAKAFAARPPSDEEVERGVTVALSVTNGHFEGILLCVVYVSCRVSCRVVSCVSCRVVCVSQRNACGAVRQERGRRCSSST
jgi:hypothetical protein